MQNEVAVFYPASVTAWRKWLEKHHCTAQSVWVVFYTKGSGKKTITWSEAVDVALCYGWIDSKKIKIDEVTSHQFFSRRKPKSTWSKINKDKVEKLIEKGWMTKAGMEAINVAKQNGSWTLLDAVEALEIPPDLEKALQSTPNAREYFMNLSKSTRKAMLQWLVLARQPATRQKRMVEIVERASQKMKPKQF